MQKGVHRRFSGVRACAYLRGIRTSGQDATRKSLDIGGRDGFDKRVKKLDNAMAKLGVARK